MQQVPIEELQAKLTAQKAVLSPDDLGGPVPAARRLDPKKLAGIVIDDSQATKTGDWKAATAIGPYVGDGYLHDDNVEKGLLRIRFAPKLLQAGLYTVNLFSPPHRSLATNTPVVIHTADGERTVRVDQRHGHEQRELSRKLGRSPFYSSALWLESFRFKEGEEVWVEIRNDGTDGCVIADAIQFVPLP